jgi:hypothetical protein
MPMYQITTARGFQVEIIAHTINQAVHEYDSADPSNRWGGLIFKNETDGYYTNGAHGFNFVSARVIK